MGNTMKYFNLYFETFLNSLLIELIKILCDI